MPVRKVKGGYRWGNSGKLYPTKAQAERQGRAIYASGYADGGIASLGNETAEKPASEGIYGLWKKHVPMNARIFLEALLGTPGKPITEKEFTSRELAEMEQVIQESIASRMQEHQFDLDYQQWRMENHPEDAAEAQTIADQLQARIDALQSEYPAGDVQYTDYLEEAPWHGGTTPRKTGTTLGRYTYTTDPATGYRNIVDRYDFDEMLASEYAAMNPLERAKAVIERIAGNPNLQYAGQAIGEAYIGKGGRPVEISYDPDRLESIPEFRGAPTVDISALPKVLPAEVALAKTLGIL